MLGAQTVTKAAIRNFQITPLYLRPRKNRKSLLLQVWYSRVHCTTNKTKVRDQSPTGSATFPHCVYLNRNCMRILVCGKSSMFRQNCKVLLSFHKNDSTHSQISIAS